MSELGKVDCGCWDYQQLKAEVERLRAERQAVLDCVNLYGDETLHKALDTIGWPPESKG